MDEHPTSEPVRPLNGWKDIAAYLGKSVRSVQRWEVSLGLPVHRIRTPDGQIVYAEPAEIDVWRRAQDEAPLQEVEEPPPADQPSETLPVLARPASRSRWLSVACGIALFAGGGAGGWWLARPSQAAVEIRYVGRSIEAVGRDGSVAWTYLFDSDVSAPRRVPQFVDLDGDGQSEILVPVHHAARGGGPAISDALYCFSRNGSLIWKVAPDHQFSFGGRTFGAPWELRDFVVAVTPAPRRIWIALAHHTWFPGFVLEVDPDGRAQVKYVQSGALYGIAHWMTPSGGFLAVGGTSEEHVRATIAFLPDVAPASTFPTSGSPKVVCEKCPSDLPRRILMFAAAELAGASGELFPYIFTLRPLGPGLKAQLRDGPGASIVEINPDFSLGPMEFGQRYWAAHRELESKGHLQHSADDCPDRHRKREVGEWTPEGGWRVWEVTPTPGTLTQRPLGDAGGPWSDQLRNSSAERRVAPGQD